jgi:hypothetical protein
MMIDDIGVLVFTSALNLRERALSVMETWLKDFPRGYLVGGYFADRELKMISAGDGVGEDYNSAADKQYQGLRILYAMHPGLAWYYVTGCDAYVFPGNLVDLLKGFDSREDFYIGGNCRRSGFLGEEIAYLSGGAGYALSNSSVRKILSIFDDIYRVKQSIGAETWAMSDVSLAYFLLKRWSISPTVCEGFSHYPPYHEWGDKFTCAPVAYHMLSIREMYLLHSGKAISAPGVLSRLFDLWQKIMTKRFKTKRIVNIVAKFIYARK